MTIQGALTGGVLLGFFTLVIYLRIAGIKHTRNAYVSAFKALDDWRGANEHLGVADSHVALELLEACIEALDRHIDMFFDPRASIHFQEIQTSLIKLRHETTGPNDDGGQPLPRELLGAFL
ncbi:MAG: hypothetical protein O2794_02845 [bacterium]|nr:hypothetical protein [bacterium]